MLHCSSSNIAGLGPRGRSDLAARVKPKGAVAVAVPESPERRL